MVIFNSYVKLPEGNPNGYRNGWFWDDPELTVIIGLLFRSNPIEKFTKTQLMFPDILKHSSPVNPVNPVNHPVSTFNP